MPREEVDADPTKSCSTGLHVGSLDYAKDFGSSYKDSKIIKVLVPLEHVVAVPHDYDGKKLRCSQYTILEEIKD